MTHITQEQERLLSEMIKSMCSTINFMDELIGSLTRRAGLTDEENEIAQKILTVNKTTNYYRNKIKSLT